MDRGVVAVGMIVVTVGWAVLFGCAPAGDRPADPRAAAGADLGPGGGFGANASEGDSTQGTQTKPRGYDEPVGLLFEFKEGTSWERINEIVSSLGFKLRGTTMRTRAFVQAPPGTNVDSVRQQASAYSSEIETIKLVPRGQGVIPH
jgi:hypothetical protein